jgi:hypothetical protein
MRADYPLDVFLGAMGTVLGRTLAIAASCFLGCAIGLWVRYGSIGDPLHVAIVVVFGWMVSPLHLIALLISATAVVVAVHRESLRSLAAGSLLCLVAWGAMTVAAMP